MQPRKWCMKDVVSVLASHVPESVIRRRINYLCTKGVITPLKDVKGSGSTRWFNKQNLRDLAIALDLLEQGMPTFKIYNLVRNWHSCWRDYSVHATHLTYKSRFLTISFEKQDIEGCLSQLEGETYA